MLLSICIPTYNRVDYLEQCLEYINNNKIKKINKKLFEICVSENFSGNSCRHLITKYEKKFNIEFVAQKKFINRSSNMLCSVNIANGKFCWLIGDDDILFKNSIDKIIEILKINTNINFLFLNYIENSLPFKLFKKKKNLKRIMNQKKNFDTKKKIVKFYELIDKKISPYVIGGMFQCVFKKKKWDKFSKEISKNNSKIEFSSLINTFPQTCIFIKTFLNDNVLIVNESMLAVNSEAREWSKLYPFVRTFRMSELLNKFKNSDIKYFNFYIYKNFLLRYSIPDIIYIFIKLPNYLRFINIKNLLSFLIYPNFYISILFYFGKKIKLCLKKVLRIKKF